MPLRRVREVQKAGPMVYTDLEYRRGKIPKKVMVRDRSLPIVLVRIGGVWYRGNFDILTMRNRYRLAWEEDRVRLLEEAHRELNNRPELVTAEIREWEEGAYEKMDFNNTNSLKFILLTLYRHIAKEKGETPAQVKIVIEKKWGPFQYVLDELIPIPEDDCTANQLKQRIMYCFCEAADYDVKMSEYRKLWKRLTLQPMPRKRKLSEKEKAEKAQVRATFERVLKKPVKRKYTKSDAESARVLIDYSFFRPDRHRPPRV